MPPRPGVGQGAGPGGLWPPERRPGPAQREPRAGPRQGAAPTPPPGRWGGPRRGRSGKTQAGHGRRQGRQPHAKAATASDRATAPRQSAPAGGLRPPAPRRPATRPDAGRPRAGGPAASHQPTPTAARAHGPGPDKAGPLRWGGGGRAGPVPARPAPDRPHTFFVPARHLWGRAGTTATGAAPAAGRFAPEIAGGPRGPGAAAYGAGAIPPGRGAASAAKKMPGGFPPGWTRLDEKKCGEDVLSPPLAVTADTRYPPVRRSSPKRTRCRPVPYALAVRRSPGLRSCVP